MAKIQLIIETKITDRNGKIVKRTKRDAKSFVKQFMQILEIALGHPMSSNSDLITIKDTGNADRALSFGMGNANTVMGVEAPANTSIYGIQIGTGTTPPAVTDYCIETQIAHGAGAGQMEHGATSVQTAQVSGSDMEMTIVRPFINNSGGLITVKEIALVCAMDASNYKHLIIHDAVDDAVNDGQTYTVTYTLKTTV